MRSRFLLACAVIAVIVASAVTGTTLARDDHAHSQASGRQATTLFTVLQGRSEVGAAGDPDGFGSANVLVPNDTTVCYGLGVSAIATPTEAHIHRGRRSQNGPPVIALSAPGSGSPGASSGCVSGLASSLVRAIRRHPNRYYINVHTAQFPDGAIRGQL